MPRPTATPTSANLLAASPHAEVARALAAAHTTGIAKGIYRFKTHAEMNRADEEALVRVIVTNARQRAGSLPPRRGR